MKRPEGFDRGAASNTPTPRGPSSTTAKRPDPPKRSDPPKRPDQPKMHDRTTQPDRMIRPDRTGRPESTKQSARPKQVRQNEQHASTDSRPAKPPTANVREADRAARRAAHERRRYERSEVKRFTRRSRRRRISWLVALICVLLLGGLVTGAVYSPLLSLKTVEVTGASGVDAGQVKKAVADQVGRPLALVDFSRIRTELSAFPLIRSYVTESVPPDTLVIRITERSPIAILQNAHGYSVVDSAGVELQQAAKRPADLPVLTGSAALVKSAAFKASVDVLLSLPATLVKTVDSVTAATADNVTLTLTGGTTVVWGSDENSALKGRVLAALVANNPDAVRYDVTAPNSPVFVPK